MKTICAAAAASLALAASTAWAASPFDAFKGKMKEGMYETKVEMDMSGMPGLPPGMGKQTHSMQHCVTDKDIEKGGFGKGTNERGPEKCEFKNFNMSGNTATYTMVCSEPKMTADNKVTFTGDGYNMDRKMVMDEGGQAMKMNQRMESRYKGPCK